MQRVLSWDCDIDGAASFGGTLPAHVLTPGQWVGHHDADAGDDAVLRPVGTTQVVPTQRGDHQHVADGAVA